MSSTNTADNCHFDVLSHEGKILRMDDSLYYVSILSQSACSSCHSKGVCSVSEMKEKIIEVPRKQGEIFREGDAVEILMKKSMGTSAVVLGYILPFVTLILSLIFAYQITQDEGTAGLFSIFMVIAYFGFLYLFRHRLRKTFTFSIR